MCSIFVHSSTCSLLYVLLNMVDICMLLYVLIVVFMLDMLDICMLLYVLIVVCAA